MADPSAELTINLDRVGENVTPATDLTRSQLGRVVIDAAMINYDKNQTALTRPSHVTFLQQDVAEHLLANPADVVELTGLATNDKAGLVYNRKMASDRARAADNFLRRQGVRNDQIAIVEGKNGGVAGEFGEQDPENRAVRVLVLSPASALYTVRLLQWREVDPPRLDNDFPALLIEAADIDVKAFFYFLPNDADDLPRFTAVLPTFPTPLGQSEILTLTDFVESFAEFFRFPPQNGVQPKIDLMRVLITKIIPPPQGDFKAVGFVGDARLDNWTDNKPSVVGRLILGRSVVRGQEFNGQNQPAEAQLALQSQRVLGRSGLRRRSA